jgi:hypothetical protein
MSISVREYLKSVTNEITVNDAAMEFENLARNAGGESSVNFKFNRDDIYCRGI